MRPLYACCLVLALVVSFFLGRFTTETPLSPSTARAASGDQSPAAAGGPIGPTSASDASAGQEASETIDQLLAQSISRCATEPSGLSRFFAFAETLQKIDKQNWRNAYQLSWKARVAAVISEQEHQLFLQRIGEVAGEEAMLRFRPKDPINDWETHTGRYAMQGWANRDPDAARAWLESQPAGKFRLGMLNGYLRAAGLRDAAAAYATLHQLAENPAAETQIVGALINSSDGARYAPLFETWVARGGGTGKDASRLFNQLVESQLRMDWNGKSEAVQRWFEPYLQQSYVHPLAVETALHRMMGDKAPEALLPWVERLPTGSTTQKAGVQFIMHTWASTAPDTLGTWLTKERASPHYDLGVQFFLTRQRGSLDETAWRPWLETIQDPHIREKTLSAMSAPINLR